MKKFIVSVDSCVDRFSSFLKENNVYCIRLKRITGNIENMDLYDSYQEFEGFYQELKKGALPTTSQLNPSEVYEYFSDIISREKEGDIIHLSLSSGLSNTYINCVKASEEIKSNFNRNVFVVDSLSASFGIAMLLDNLIEARNDGVDTLSALKNVIYLREHQQVWASVGNLFHLKRGGRISGFKATIGSLLNIRPILTINREGKLVIQNTVKGVKKSILYIANMINELGKKSEMHYNSQRKRKIYIMHSLAPQEFSILRDILKKEFSDFDIIEGMIGAIIGSHVGTGTVGLVFEGQVRLDIN